MRDDVLHYLRNEQLPPLKAVAKVSMATGEPEHQVFIDHYWREEHDKAYQPQFLSIWPEVEDISSRKDDAGYTNVDLSPPLRGTQFLAYCEAVSQSVKFPLSTVILHGLACVASAAVKSFSFEMYGQDDHPVNLFCVSAQPPASGKSAVHNKFVNPIRHAYRELNKRNEAKRGELKKQIEDLEKQMAESPAGSPQASEQYRAYGELQEEYRNHPIWKYSVDDATPESMEAVAGNQCGMINIMSSESDAVNIVLGNVYSDRKANHGMFLKMFDGDWHSPSRVTRATVEGRVYGCLGVIAQDESIQSILHAGSTGRGISERILLLRERNNLGGRDFNVWQGVDEKLSEWYFELVDKLVSSCNKVLRFEASALHAINDYRNQIEPELADGGDYSNNMLRGALGKADKHIARIASILHLMTDWDRDVSNHQISEATTVMAINVYDQLRIAYMQVTDGQGYAGDTAAMETCAAALSEIKEKKKASVIKVNDLFKLVKNRKPFATMPSGTAYLKEQVVPQLIESGHIAAVYHGRSCTIYISPNV